MPDPKRPKENPNPNPNPKRPTTPCIQDSTFNTVIEFGTAVYRNAKISTSKNPAYNNCLVYRRGWCYFPCIHGQKLRRKKPIFCALQTQIMEVYCCYITILQPEVIYAFSYFSHDFLSLDGTKICCCFLSLAYVV